MFFRSKVSDKEHDTRMKELDAKSLQTLKDSFSHIVEFVEKINKLYQSGHSLELTEGRLKFAKRDYDELLKDLSTIKLDEIRDKNTRQGYIDLKKQMEAAKDIFVASKSVTINISVSSAPTEAPRPGSRR